MPSLAFWWQWRLHTVCCYLANPSKLSTEPLDLQNQSSAKTQGPPSCNPAVPPLGPCSGEEQKAKQTTFDFQLNARHCLRNASSAATTSKIPDAFPKTKLLHHCRSHQPSLFGRRLRADSFANQKVSRKAVAVQFILVTEVSGSMDSWQGANTYWRCSSIRPRANVLKIKSRDCNSVAPRTLPRA